MKYLVYTNKIWNLNNFKVNKKNFLIKKKLNYKYIKKTNPKIIFFIYWSEIIPDKIFKNYLCIQFHTSDLPKYKGGSPIQNQILNKVKKTKISAFKINGKIDNGPICLKRNISLDGSAKQIYINIEKKIVKMINFISKLKKIKFSKQIGAGSFYKRRLPNDSRLDLNKQNNLKDIYDFIRCTDAPGYPKACIETNNFKLELFDAKIGNRKINAKIKITKKK